MAALRENDALFYLMFHVGVVAVCEGQISGEGALVFRVGESLKVITTFIISA